MAELDRGKTSPQNTFNVRDKSYSIQQSDWMIGTILSMSGQDFEDYLLVDLSKTADGENYFYLGNYAFKNNADRETCKKKA